MNILVAVMRKTLTDLDLGLKGALSMSNQMQQLFEDINLNKVCSPASAGCRKGVVQGRQSLIDSVRESGCGCGWDCEYGSGPARRCCYRKAMARVLSPRQQEEGRALNLKPRAKA